MLVDRAGGELLADGANDQERGAEEKFVDQPDACGRFPAKQAHRDDGCANDDWAVERPLPTLAGRCELCREPLAHRRVPPPRVAAATTQRIIRRSLDRGEHPVDRAGAGTRSSGVLEWC